MSAASVWTYRALDDKGIDYEIADVSQDPAALEMVKELGYLQAPVVITDEDHWSGFGPTRSTSLLNDSPEVRRGPRR